MLREVLVAIVHVFKSTKRKKCKWFRAHLRALYVILIKSQKFCTFSKDFWQHTNVETAAENISPGMIYNFDEDEYCQLFKKKKKS